MKSIKDAFQLGDSELLDVKTVVNEAVQQERSFFNAPFFLISHLKIHNANAMSSPYTIGFPAMTAWLVHACTST
jgi:hypothetical protein